MLHFFHLTICLLLIVFVSQFGCSNAKPVQNEEFGNSKNEVKTDYQNRSQRYSGDKISWKHGIGLSAWGMLGVILAIILTGIFMYYFFLFYPILCRKEGKYDVIEHSRDTTPMPNSNNVEKLT